LNVYIETNEPLAVQFSHFIRRVLHLHWTSSTLRKF